MLRDTSFYFYLLNFFYKLIYLFLHLFAVLLFTLYFHLIHLTFEGEAKNSVKPSKMF